MSMWKRVGSGEWVGHDASDRFPVYTRGNAGEVYPEVFTPLSYSIASEAGERAMRNAILYAGFIRPEELEGVPLTTAVGSGVFGGYAYLNLSIQRVASSRMPGGKPEDADLSFLGTGDPPEHVERPGDRNLKGSLAGMRFVWKCINGKVDDFSAILAADQRNVERWLAELPSVETASEAELGGVVDDEFLGRFAGLFETHLKVSLVAGVLLAALTNLCEKQLDDADLAVQLLAGIGDIDSAAPARALWDLGRLAAADPALNARFEQGVDDSLLGDLRADAGAAATGFCAEFDRFLAEHGSRGPNEWDTAFDTWGTNPTLALQLVDRMRVADADHDPHARQTALAAERERLERDSIERVPRPLRKMFARTLAAAQLYSQHRERAKTTVVRLIHGMRLRSMELDRRLVATAQAAGVTAARRGDLWFIVKDELDDYVADPAALADRIAERRAQHARLDERVPPFFFERTQPPLDDWELRSAGREAASVGEVLTGLPGCTGVARGRARVVTDPGDPRGLDSGDVLIAPLTDPSWTPLFVPAQAVVVDVGAVMSHAVIVSRELGIPCAVSVTDATKRIPDGALIEVDGTAGTVTVIELP